MAIYTELLGFKDSLIARSMADVTRLSSAAQAELGRGDLRALNAQRERWRARLEFWYERYWDLHGLEMDEDTHEVRYRGHSRLLTGREFQLLAYLVANPGRQLPARQLIEQAWRDSRLSAEQMRLYISRLRRHLKELELPCVLANHPRRGYSLVWTDEAAAIPEQAV